jgi:uncharacterized membrane protein YphA (DoxX/SURF4 family)
MTDAKLSDSKLFDISYMGLRTVIGVMFIAHSLSKFEPGFVGFLTETVELF